MPTIYPIQPDVFIRILYKSTHAEIDKKKCDFTFFEARWEAWALAILYTRAFCEYSILCKFRQFQPLVINFGYSDERQIERHSVGLIAVMQDMSLICIILVPKFSSIRKFDFLAHANKSIRKANLNMLWIWNNCKWSNWVECEVIIQGDS